MGFADRLDARARAIDSLLCVGLDPHAADLTEDTADAARAFCLRLIAATAPFAAAFKPNSAFFERFGAAGFEALRDVIRAARASAADGVPVILDNKRGDIATTAAAYADASFHALDADAVTLHPWLGVDGIAPFVTDPERGAFVLCRTSNPSAVELQSLEVAGEPLYVEVARRLGAWAPQGNAGLVVGATAPDELRRVREVAPHAWILAPGVGAQGGSLEDTVAAGVRADGLGLLVNVSRGLSRAADPGAEAARLVGAMRAAIAARSSASTGRRADPLDQRVAAGLLAAGCVKFGSFKLKSGLMSPIYLDLRRLIGHPALLADVSASILRVARGLAYDVLAPLPYAAMPIGTAMSLQSGVPMVYPRREVKEYGTKAAVEGIFEPGQRALVVDDLATTGDSKIEGAEKLRAVGLVAEDIVVLIDRESGADAILAGAGMRLHAAWRITELLDLWSASGAITPAQADDVRAFLIASRKGA